jgi:hypothetical protein
LLLVGLAFRALLPQGFMPSTERPLTLEICRAGYLARLDPTAPAQHPQGAPRSEFCPFGTAPGAAAIPFVATLPMASTVVAAPAIDFLALRIARRVERAHPARGPPRPA